MQEGGWGRAPPAGSRAEPQRGSGGGAPCYILAAKPPRGLGGAPTAAVPPLATPLKINPLYLISFQSLRLSLIHLGLFVFVILYVLFGALVLHKIEGHAERQDKMSKKISANRTALHLQIAAAAFWKEKSARRNKRDPPETRFREILQKFFQAGLKEGKNPRGLLFSDVFHPKHEVVIDESELSWAYGNAILFTFSAITTIGEDLLLSFV